MSFLSAERTDNRELVADATRKRARDQPACDEKGDIDRCSVKNRVHVEARSIDSTNMDESRCGRKKKALRV